MNFLLIWVVLFLGFYYVKNLKMMVLIMNVIDVLFGFWIVVGGLIVSKIGIVSIDIIYLGV